MNFDSPFLYYFKKYRKSFKQGISALFVANALDAFMPLLIGMAIDQVAEGFVDYSSGLSLYIIIAVALVLSYFRYLWRVIWGRFFLNSTEDLRNNVFEKYIYQGPGFFKKFTVGELMNSLTNDMNFFKQAVGPAILILFDAFFASLFILPIMFYTSVEWTLKTLILMPFVPFILKFVSDQLHKKFTVKQEKLSEISHLSQEMVHGIRVIKGYAREHDFLKSFNVKSKEFEQACNKVEKIDSYFHPVMELSVSVGGVILLLIAGPQIISGAITIGQFYAFYRYVERMVWPMTALGMGLSEFTEGQAAVKRIKKFATHPNEIQNQGKITFNSFEKLEVKNLSYTFEDATTAFIQNLNFTLNKGEVLGVIGLTGSGKSTLINLITRNLTPPKNSIFINGEDILNIELSNLRNLLSVVPQESFLFSQSIEDNINFGLDSKTNKLTEQVSDIVDIKEEIENLNFKYDTLLGEKGVNLSGGQKQRLSIARAIIRKKPFLIFDDSLSSVDSITEKTILKGINDFVKSQDVQPTLIVATHRITSLSSADKVIVLNNGRQEAFGKQSEILSSSKIYKNLLDLQTNGGLNELT